MSRGHYVVQGEGYVTDQDSQRHLETTSGCLADELKRYLHFEKVIRSVR